MIITTANAQPLGATTSGSKVDFRVWAPGRTTVSVVFETGDTPPLLLSSQADGYFAGSSDRVSAGVLYRYRLDDTENLPDPYSRFQPRGPHGPSMIVDPLRYRWRDSAWKGLDPACQVVYELHVGTFTGEGTYDSAREQLRYLRDLGITCIELMPVNEFAGRFGWGYDGVNWFAPHHVYGEPDALRAFIDQAHELELGVVLDVVYNHFGHEGNYLPRFAAAYFTDTPKNPWGITPDYGCDAMRQLAIDNAAYWIHEFHFDGLRLDAIQSVHDPNPPTLLRSIVREARRAADTRSITISAEDYMQRTPLLDKNGSRGAGIDHLWNDDFHHACRAALTGNHYGYFQNYRGSAQEILSSLKHGFLYQGQYDGWSKTYRGFAVTNEPLCSFVVFTQNHDAVANTLFGQRLHTIVSPGKYRALTAVLLLGPQTPLIFMGQEFAASSPFAYFADYPNETGLLWNGRKQEAEQFLQYRDPGALARILNPCSQDTVSASTLDHAERLEHAATIRLFTDLIALRRRFTSAATCRDVDGAVLTRDAFVFRWLDTHGNDRLLLVNLGAQVELRAWAEPLLAPPAGGHWRQIWSSDSAQYGGMGVVEVCDSQGWRLSAESACLLVTTPADSSVPAKNAP